MIQNKIEEPTTEAISVQRNAIYRKIGDLIDAAGSCGVNIICLQEAWRKLIKYLFNMLYKYLFLIIYFVKAMPFAFCTREKEPWCEFAESAENGPTTNFLKAVIFFFFIFHKDILLKIDCFIAH